MLERKCVKSCRSLQHCYGVTSFKQAENQSRNHALRKRPCCECMLRTKIRYLCQQTSHCFIHWFDATNFCEQPNDVIFNGDTSLFESFHRNNVTQLNLTTCLCTPINKNTVYFYYPSYTYFFFLILLRKKCQARFIF